MKYRKKPVVIEAVQVKGPDFNGKTFDGSPFDEVPQWLEEAIDNETITIASTSTDYAQWDIHTLEGTHRASPGDYIIRGVQGELYPCKPDIFKETYDPVSTLDDIGAEEIERLKHCILFEKTHDAHQKVRDFLDSKGITNAQITWTQDHQPGCGTYTIKDDERRIDIDIDVTG